MGTLGTRLDSGLKLDLNFTSEFIITILDRKTAARKRIQVLPDEIINESPELSAIMAEGNTHIVSMNDNLTLTHEIVLSKTVFTTIFLESYQYIHRAKELRREVNLVNYQDIKKATFGLLFATSLDTSALRMNLEVLELNNYGKDVLYETYFLVAGYLTCNYEKTNKSSCLWEYFKRLHVWLYDILPEKSHGAGDMVTFMDEWVSCGGRELLIAFSIKTCLRSLEQHPRNYYACNSLRFFLSKVNTLELREKIFKELIEYAMQNPGDFSLWMVICSSVVDLKTNEFASYRREWKRHSRLESKEKQQDLGNCERLINELYEKMRDFALATGCYGGLLAAFVLNFRLNIWDNLESEIVTTFKDFEAEHNVEINTKRKCLRDCATGQRVDLKNDLLLREDFNLALSMKRAWEDAIAMNMQRKDS